ncbi:MAG TPA: hypothetical protein VMS78_10090 [Rhizomicrobium sp.]|nr:hypothetical protein [Rhizomicrobium sp.]
MAVISSQLSLTAMVVLFVFERVGRRLRRDHRALLELTTSGTSLSADDVRMRLRWTSAGGQSAAASILEELRACRG